MLKTVIIEDEPLTAEKLSFLLFKIRNDVKVEAILPSIAESVNWLKTHHVDLIFMDMHLSDGNALEIFKQVKVEIPIIFTTAYDQYALEAFKEFGIDYLMKPIVMKDLERALHKFEYLKSSTFNNEKLDSFIDKLKDDGQKNFLVNTGKEIKVVPTSEISCFYAEEKSVYLINTEGRRFILDDTLEKIEQVVPKFFYRANRKVIINLNRISNIENHTYSRLFVKIDPQPQFDIIIPLERVSGFKASIINKN